jgi:pyridoxamine 5'-phosphate oxidase
MEYREIAARLEEMLSQAHVAQLATVDGSGWPRIRWMTPTLLPRLPGRIYALTSPRFAKAAEIAARPEVTWSIQSRTLDAIIEARGRATLIDLPQLKTEVMEAIGPHLQVFWRANPEAHELVVIETELEELSLFLPLSQERARVEVPRG